MNGMKGLCRGSLLSLALLIAATAPLVAQTPKAGDPSPGASPGLATPQDATPAGPPAAKTTNRAAAVEPPEPAGSEPSTATAEPAPSESTSPPVAKPAARPARVPVFANPGVQTLGPGATADQPAQTTSLKPGEPDWRVSASPPDAAFGAFQRGHYVEAMREALKAVEADPSNSAAMTLIGELYRDGLGVKQNFGEALRWYLLANQRDDPQAAFALARAHIEGRGVPQDYVKARAYLERAAAKNHAGALYNLGIMTIEAEVQDFRKAADYFRRGMENGNIDATYSLALLYRNGQGIEKDEARATQLLKQAADEHHLPAMIDYAIALFNGRGASADETGAAAYLIRAAWRNAPVAQNRLARMYVAGRGVKSDIVEAMKWHVLARANGLKDDWLEDKLTRLTASQREIVEEAVRKYAVK